MKRRQSLTTAAASRALNAKAGGEVAVRAFCFQLPAATEGVPAWIPYLPAPDAHGRVTGEDGRSWLISDVRALCAKPSRKLPVDVNHAGEIAARQGGESPASGWITDFQQRDDGSIWAKVDWNARGSNALQNKDYGFISPTFDFDAKTTRITRFVAASLVNEPNFTSLALNRAGHHPTQDSTMNLEALLALLGLPATATQDEASRAINALKTEATRATNAPDLARFVPRADYDALSARATNAESALQSERSKQHGVVVDAEIAAALKAGKITPATEAYHRANCASEAGLTAFRSFVAAAPVVVSDETRRGNGAGDGKDASGLTESQRAICRRLEITPEAYAKTLSETATAAA